MNIIDAHQHFWSIGAPGQVWPDASWPRIYRDFGPAELRAAAAGLNLVGSVLVQSQADDRDTDWLLDHASGDSLVTAVVGWADLEAPHAAARVVELARRPKVRGLRPMLQSISEDDWILRPALDPALEAMVEQDLSFDALVQPRHLRPLAEFARRWPQLPIVIDHGAKPHIARQELDPWREEIAAVAALPNVWCKLSGLRTEQAPGAPVEALRPYVDHLLALFPGRLMWGSDWPVLLHAGDSYADWLTAAGELTAGVDDAERQAIFSGAAARFYRIDQPRAPTWGRAGDVVGQGPPASQGGVPGVASSGAANGA